LLQERFGQLYKQIDVLMQALIIFTHPVSHTPVPCCYRVIFRTNLARAHGKREWTVTELQVMSCILLTQGESTLHQLLTN